MNYTQATEYINSFSRSGRPVTDLSRFSALMKALSEPYKSFRSVHIAGTNGKGSTCEYISNALKENGLVTGKFTSPYIECIEERIQINGKYISKQAFALLADEVRQAADACSDRDFSQFEILCAICFLYFAKEQVDIAVVEVGIGGSLDCTNVITPAVSVITSVDLDHTDILGDTVEKVAEHKAGIVKKGIPCVLSPCQHDKVSEVVEKRCADMSARLILPDISRVNIIDMDSDDAFFSYKGASYHIRMSGEHQIRNAVTAIETCRVLGVPYGKAFTGLEKSVLPARMEKIEKNGIKYIIDGSHNPDAMRAAAKMISLMKRKPTAVIGMMKSKDFDTALSILLPCLDRIVFTDSFAPSSADADELCAIAKRQGKSCIVCHDTEAALECAKSEADGSPILVTGSLYLASSARAMIKQHHIT